MKNQHVIAKVEPGSIAQEMGLEPGDAVVSIDGQKIVDVFDYQYYIEENFLEMEIFTKDGQTCILEIEKEEDEDLGIVFASSLMDDYHSCSNQCIFCFIDQMPPGMRPTLYFKDDDSRLSFLQGNYITLTNMKEEEIDRLIKYRLSPINISVHATNPDLRCAMLHNRFAGSILEKIRRFYEAGIEMNSQVVLCKGINDGHELDRTIEELSAFSPFMSSLSVVPVGLTRYREGLAKLEPFDKEEAREVLSQIRSWQQKLKKQYGTVFVHASDEWYILADEPFPTAEEYEGYGLLENGVGMVRLLLDEVTSCLHDLKETDFLPEEQRTISVATGELIYPTICKLAENVMASYPMVRIRVHRIRNDFFGEKITVSGLLTGQDIIAQLQGKDLGQTLYLPENVLRAGEEILLDDISLNDISRALHIPVNIIESEGRDFVYKLIGMDE